MMVALGGVDWSALGEALNRGGKEALNRAEAAGAAWAAGFALISITWSVIAIAALYPAFQAMVLRWWISGLRFGELSATSHLRTGAVYSLYWRFVWMSMLAGLVVAIVGLIAGGAIWGVSLMAGKGASRELLQGAIGIGVYVIAALAYSTIYQATVKLRLWRQGFESAELTNVEVLDRVRAAPATGSPVGEGFADALHVGGI
jgi:uncharacterized membrane protein YjgN (DUF898 family)